LGQNGALSFCPFLLPVESIMALSQPATFNEPWSDERVFAYLNILPPAGVDADYHVLYNAYKHMRPHDFERLLTQFKADGRNVSATAPNGQTLAQEIQVHPQQSTPFIELLSRYA
jgi:predicted phosphoadenosine phosphosulfate sulfurtransferase